MKTILVTGGCGFIGSNFIRHMLKKRRDVSIINLDKLTYAGNINNLKDIAKDKRYKFIKGDICNEKLVNSILSTVDSRQSTVINFAAETHVDRSIKDASAFIKTNIDGVRVLLGAAKKHKIKKFIQISTDEVYGDIEKGLSAETDALLPNSPYAASKAAADLLCLSYYRTYKMPIVIVRSSNNFGPYQYPEKVMPLFITNLIEGKKIPLYGDGKNIREWLFVEDNCSGIERVFLKGKTGQIYNIGSGKRIHNLDMAKTILKKSGLKYDRIKFVNDRPGHDRRYALDSGKLKKFGWRPLHSFDQALGLTIKWYRDNKWWWKPLKTRANIIEW